MNIFENINELKAIYNGEKYQRIPKLKTRKKKADFSFLDVITHIVFLVIDGLIYLRNMIFEMLEHIYDIIIGSFQLCHKLYRQKYSVERIEKSAPIKINDNRYQNIEAEGLKKVPTNKRDAYRARKLELKKYMRRNMQMMMHDMEE